MEDDDTIRETIAEALMAEGFDVDAEASGGGALDRFKGSPDVAICDLVLLDLMLPGVNGLDFCRYLRRRGFTTPILMVSARDSETDRVVGLEVGADDYLVKPFSIRELVARCRALLRRSKQDGSNEMNNPTVIHYGDIALYPAECRATCRGENVNLTPKEYKLLEVFMNHPRQVWSREKLLERVWEQSFVGDSKTVDVHIRWLRAKLEEVPSKPQLIVTVRGFGYRFG